MKKNEDIKWDASNPVRFTHIVFDGEIHKLDNMIKANELRIGNWVMLAGAYWQIGFAEEIDVHHFEPIELSPEILEKAGLTKSDKVDIAYTISIFTNLPDGKIHRYHKEGLSEPKYLHQLQNLYFALTGTELEINL